MYSIAFWLIVFLGITIVLLINSGHISVKKSYPGLFILVGFALILLITSYPTLYEIGLKIPSSIDLLFYFVTTITLCIAIQILHKFSHNKSLPIRSLLKDHYMKIIFYIMISAPIQEFMFRSFVYYSLQATGSLNMITMIAISSLLYGIAHIVFRDPYLRWGSYFLGIIWGAAYYSVPNLGLISVSHIVVGIYALNLGLISPKLFFTEM